MKTIVLVRHGQTVAPLGAFCGRTDISLSAHGKLQSRQCALSLLQQGVQVVVTTGVRRTDYVGIHAAVHGARHIIQPNLREVDFGEWEGKTWAQIQSSHPDLAARWVDEPLAVQFPAGEAMTACIERIGQSWQEILRLPEEVIAIVSHAGVLGYLLQQFRGDATPPYLEYGQVTQLTVHSP